MTALTVFGGNPSIYEISDWLKFPFECNFYCLQWELV